MTSWSSRCERAPVVRRRATGSVALATSVGSVELVGPVCLASGTAGHGAELAPYLDLAALGAVVVKSLSADPWAGNPPPRVHETPAGMLNSVGLQGPGVDAWIDDELGELEAAGARVVASIWGTTVEDFARAATALARAGDRVAAVEVNVSCPNHHDGGRMFAQVPDATAEVLRVVGEAVAVPRWAKLTAATAELTAVAGAAADAGAEAVTLINTVPGLVLDLEARRPLLAGGRGGGLSGPAIHPVAVRCVFDVHAAHPDLPVVGCGGVAGGADAVELLLAGASAVQVGTATFADPRAAARVTAEVHDWCAHHGVADVRELIGGAHG